MLGVVGVAGGEGLKVADLSNNHHVIWVIKVPIHVAISRDEIEVERGGFATNNVEGDFLASKAFGSDSGGSGSGLNFVSTVGVGLTIDSNGGGGGGDEDVEDSGATEVINGDNKDNGNKNNEADKEANNENASVAVLDIVRGGIMHKVSFYLALKI